MKSFNKKQHHIVVQARGVASDKFVVQFNKAAPHFRLYERKPRGSTVINARVGEFYRLKSAIQRAWSLSQES